MTNERMEECYFCGKEYIETWHFKDLAAMVCPECCKIVSQELEELYPEKMKALAK